MPWIGALMLLMLGHVGWALFYSFIILMFGD